MLCGRPSDNAQDGIILRYSVFDSLQDDCHHSISPEVAISLIVKGFARTRLRQELALGKTGEDVRVGQHIHSAGKDCVAVSGRSEVQASWIAAKLLEQAVSKLKLGPLKP